MSLTQEQVDEFLTGKLGIPDWREKLKKSKFNFFFELDKKLKLSTYYEALTWGAKPLDELRPPTVEEAKHLFFEQNGGACLQLNYPTYLLLQHLGYDTFAIGAKTIMGNMPNNHILIIVRFPKGLSNDNDNAGELNLPDFETHHHYLVDVGWIRAFPSTFLLNNLPHVFSSAGFKIEHRYNQVTRKFEILFHGGDPMKGPFADNTEYLKYAEYNLTPCVFEDYHETMSRVFTDSTLSYFLNTISMSRFLQLESEEDYLFVNFIGRKMSLMTPTKVDTKRFETYADMIPEINKYFPGINQEILGKALNNYAVRQAKS